MNLQRVLAIMHKEWRETTRDRMFLSLAFLMPVLWMVVFGYGLVLDVDHIPIVAVDRDQSAMSRDYVYRYIESRYFDFRGAVQSDREVDDLLQRGAVRAAIIIPEKFEERLRSGAPASVQTLIDGTFPLRTDLTTGYVIAINNAFSRDLMLRHLSRARGLRPEEADRLSQPLILEVRYLYNEEVRSTWSMVPALLMFALMLASPLLTALGIVREKETGSIYNIYSSTVSRVEFLAGKLSLYVLVSFANVLVLWLVATQWFGVPFKGHLPFFLAASFVFVLTTTGIGLLISLLVNTQLAALLITIVVSIVPTILFSGLMIPVSSLEPASRIQAHLFPGMYYTNIVRGSFLKGLGADALWVDLLALLLYALILRLVAYQLFTKRPAA